MEQSLTVSSSNLKKSQLGNKQYYSNLPLSKIFSSGVIRIFCDVLVLLFQVLFVGTMLQAKKMIMHCPMARLNIIWKRSRRKELAWEDPCCVSSRTSSATIHRNSYIKYFFQFLCYLLFINNFHPLACAPVSRASVASSSVQHYLLKFGYLPQSGFEIRNQVSEERMRDAVRELQGFANLTVTGELDDATLKLIKTPRCGVPDILTGQFNSSPRHKRYIVQGQRWQNTSLTWSLKIPTLTHNERDIIDELDKAFNVWSKSTLLRFTRLGQERADDADIRIVFSKGYHDDGYPFDGKGSILAHAFFPGTGQGGDAHFDDDEVWVIGGRSHHGDGTRLFAVAAHEFGHSLGLSHSDVEGSLMYPWYQNFDYDLQLSQDDKLGIERIYGSGSKFSPNPYNPKGGGGGGTRNDIPRPQPPATTRRPAFRGKNYYPDGRPNTCDSSYDAISLIRDELFIFKGRYFWRINSTPNDNRLLKGYPSLITIMWQQLPSNLTHVDAVYEHNEVEIIFFIGRQYWRFRGTELMPGYPQPLTSMGISIDVEKIDGAMIWGYNKKTYLFSGTKYWRLQDDSYYFRIEPDYPRDMHIWAGVPNNIDSVLRWKDGNVYFFKGKVFWKFDDKHMRVESKTPTLSAPFWMGCTSTPIIPTDSTTAEPPVATDDASTTRFHTMTPSIFLVLAIAYALPKLMLHWSLSTNAYNCLDTSNF